MVRLSSIVGMDARIRDVMSWFAKENESCWNGSASANIASTCVSFMICVLLSQWGIGLGSSYH